MRKELLTLALMLVIFLAGFYLYLKKNDNSIDISVGDGLNESEFDLSDFEWDTYTNTYLGISFQYPKNQDNNADWTVGNGEQGKVLQVTIKGLPSANAVIYGYSATKDYAASKGGFPVGVEGFVEKDGKYRNISRGVPVSEQFAFVPDEIWTLQNGEVAIYQRLKTGDPEIYSPHRAQVNLNGTEFTGMGFVLVNQDPSKPLTSTDLEVFKEVVTSITLQ